MEPGNGEYFHTWKREGIVLKKFWILLITLILAICCALAGAEVSALSQLNTPGMTVGVDQGSAAEQIVRRELPDATIAYYSDKPSAYLAVAQGKLDAFAFDYNQMRIAIESGVKGVRLLDETLGEPVRIAVGLSPVSGIPDLKDSMNRFLAQLREEDILDDMFKRWVMDGSEVMPEIEKTESRGLHLTVGTSGIAPPYSYYAGTELTGFDIELAKRFAAWLGADLQLKVYDYGSIVPAAVTGDVDCIMANLNITPERAEALPFSDVLYEERVGVMVRGDATTAVSGAYTSLAQLDGRRIGIQTGSTFDGIVLETLPDVQLSYYNMYPDLVAALKSGKIDGFPGDDPVLRMMMAEDSSLDILDEAMEEFEYGFVLPKTAKGERLLAELNAWLESIRASGELESMMQKWIEGSEEEKTVPDYAHFPATNGELILATEGEYPPMDYFRGNEVIGFEIDLAARFCEANGYRMKIAPMNFDGILSAVQASKADFAAAGIAITEERRQNVNFSVPYYSGGTVMMVLGSPRAASGVHWQDYNGKRIGVLEGTLLEDIASTWFPDSEQVIYKSYTDCSSALLAGRIDAYLADEPDMKELHAQRPDIDYIHDRITETRNSFAFRKNDPKSAALCSELNAFLARSHEDGTIQELEDIWFGDDETRKTLDMSGLSGENGTLKVVTTSTDAPYSYIKDGNHVGYDIDLVVRFCRDRGYALEIGEVDFGGRIPALQSGKYDFTTDMNVTPEREEEVLFSDATSMGGIVLAVKSTDLQAAVKKGTDPAVSSDKPFLDSIRDSFQKTFLRENRYSLFLSGIETTLQITLASILLGTLLGFAVFMLCRRGNAVANAVTRFSFWLVQGMPMVVLLMILYYIVFGHVEISGNAVAVIGFTLTFGSAVFGLLKMGVGAVDRGQYEAAYALGYSDRRTFFRIILPQAIPHVLPAYKGEVVSLIKATAIVGYIAVLDLTKMGDIVRSRTYEAFFPLIAVTIIYFMLEGMLGFLISRMSTRFNPKHRSPADILRGVKTND